MRKLSRSVRLAHAGIQPAYGDLTTLGLDPGLRWGDGGLRRLRCARWFGADVQHRQFVLRLCDTAPNISQVIHRHSRYFSDWRLADLSRIFE